MYADEVIARTRNSHNVSFAELHPWPQADKEFLERTVIAKNAEIGSWLKENDEKTGKGFSMRPEVVVHEGFMRRQQFLRSYPFTSKEEIMVQKTVAVKTKDWVKDKRKIIKKWLVKKATRSA